MCCNLIVNVFSTSQCNVTECIIIPSSKLPLAFPLPSESCEVEVLDETDYPYPIVFFFGDIHLYTNGTHQTEEKHRFKSESLNDDDKLDSQAYEMHPQLNATPYNSDIDVEITTVNATSSVSSQLPPTVNDHKNTPFAQLNDVPDMRRDGSNKSNDGSSRVWQCALLGLPWEVNVEVGALFKCNGHVYLRQTIHLFAGLVLLFGAICRLDMSLSCC